MRVLDLDQCSRLVARVEDGDVGYAVAPVRKWQPPFGDGADSAVEQVEEVVVSVWITGPRDELGGVRALIVEVPRGMVVTKSERAVGAGRQLPTEQLQEGVFPLLMLLRWHVGEST